jgi:hypothetical protein
LRAARYVRDVRETTGGIPRRRNGRVRIVRHDAHATTRNRLHRAAGAAGSSRMRSRRQPAFIDCH